MRWEKVRVEKDPRVNAGTFSGKYYLIVSLALIVISGMDIWLLLTVNEAAERVSNFLIAQIAIMWGYLLFVAVILTAVITVIRQYYFERPLRHLREAAKKIARGDFSVRLAPLRKDGKKDSTAVLFDDFNTMAAELANIETLKNEFIANVSHEIKTPLSIIQSYAAALQNDALTGEERRDYAKTIMDATQRLSALVTNILKLNKLENQEIMPQDDPFDLSEQIRRCVLAFEDLLERNNIAVNVNFDEVMVSCNQSMLELVWNNLISNAVKFTNPGGLIALTLKETDGYAVITITDNGCGMDSETQKHIFDKFYQGDSSHAQEGNGLGLAMVKKVIEITGGKIKVDSKPGHGTTFTVCLKI
ncbi:two component sensor kinase [Spirochaetia bacterium]|nr:two component sensor kinase [Spirochaetia bacterium]